jgi:surface antigen
VNRTGVVTLRRTLGGGAIFALSFGTFSSSSLNRPISVVAAAPILPLSSPREAIDEPRPQQARAAVLIYVEATPEPTPVATPTPAPPVPQLMSRAAASLPQSWAGAGNGFDYGYCTWWVANKRVIPWRGNAVEWWWNARPFGFAEGPTPRAGAILVLGVSGTSPLGHVAYVESVSPNGSFVVSEMNWWGVPGGGWNRVDYRTVTSMQDALGFIY